MESVLAKVLEVLAEDVVAAVRAHDSYKQLVEALAQKAIASAASGSAGEAGPTSGA
jgi:hypothetical protein